MSVHECSRYGDLDELKTLLAASTADINACTAGSTPLMASAANGHVEIVRILLQHGADVSVRNDTGNTALHWACLMGHADVVRLLLEAGAVVDTRNDFGKSPLHEASSRGHDACVALLVPMMAVPGDDPSFDQFSGVVDETDGDKGEAEEVERAAEAE